MRYQGLGPRLRGQVNLGPRPAQPLWLFAGRSTWVPACAGTGLDERPLNQYSPAPAKAGAQYRNHLRGIKLTGPRPAQPLGLYAGRSTWVPACAGTGRVKWFAIFSCRINRSSRLKKSIINGHLQPIMAVNARPIRTSVARLLLGRGRFLCKRQCTACPLDAQTSLFQYLYRCRV
jgi:hypothetical protein